MKYLFTLLCLTLVCSNYSIALQVYANSQTTGSGGLCIGCNVSNANNAADGNPATYSTLNVTVGTLGAYLYQTVSFPSSGSPSDYVGFIIEDVGGGPLNASLLGGLEITTYNGASSNLDTRGSAAISINLFSGSTYKIEFQSSATFTKVEFKLNAGILGALNNLRIYYAYYDTSPLPLEFLNFAANSDGENVKLNWQTTGELNCNYFVIESSTDFNNFREIGIVKSKSFSSINSYSFIDQKPNQVNYYRLKQVDLNGAYKYSKIVSAIPTSSEDKITSFFNKGNLLIKSAKPGSLNLSVYDIKGNLICHKDLQVDNSPQTLRLNEFIKSGFYFYSLSKENRVIKQEKFFIDNLN